MAVTNFIPAIWAASLQEQFEHALSITPTVNREYEGHLGKGNVVKITALAKVTVQDYKAAGRKHTVEDLNTTQIDLLIDQEKAVAFKVDDIDRAQVAGSLESATTGAGRALAEDVENFLIAQMKANGRAVTSAAPTTGDDAYNIIVKLRTQLTTKSIPTQGRYLAVSPDFAALLLGASSRLAAADTAGATGELRNGVLGRVSGFTVLEHPALTGLQAIGYHGDGVSLVQQIDDVEGLRASDSFADIVRALSVYGGRVTYPDAVAVHTAG